MPYLRILLLVLVSIYIWSCSDNSESPSIEDPTILNLLTEGSGYIEYSDYAPLEGRVMRVYYHVPQNYIANSPILFVFHGNGRNAKDYRDAMVNKSEQYGFLLISPEFSNSNFPGGDQYNLGNVFVDGDNPSPQTLNPEEEWTFSIIEPLFDHIIQLTGNSNTTYFIFGHSAGGQFAHRYVEFKPNARYTTVVASGSGWYTVTDSEIQFPYGFGQSPLENVSNSILFKKKLIIQIGSLDNDPNASGLRHNEFADAQGLHRLDRAEHFYNTGLNISIQNNLEFNWELHINTGADHDFTVASNFAADLIFN